MLWRNELEHSMILFVRNERFTFYQFSSTFEDWSRGSLTSTTFRPAIRQRISIQRMFKYMIKRISSSHHSRDLDNWLCDEVSSQAIAISFENLVSHDDELSRTLIYDRETKSRKITKHSLLYVSTRSWARWRFALIMSSWFLFIRRIFIWSWRVDLESSVVSEREKLSSSMMSSSSYLTIFTFFLLECSERSNAIDMILSDRSIERTRIKSIEAMQKCR